MGRPVFSHPSPDLTGVSTKYLPPTLVTWGNPPRPSKTLQDPRLPEFSLVANFISLPRSYLRAYLHAPCALSNRRNCLPSSDIQETSHRENRSVNKEATINVGKEGGEGGIQTTTGFAPSTHFKGNQNLSKHSYQLPGFPTPPCLDGARLKTTFLFLWNTACPIFSPEFTRTTSSLTTDHDRWVAYSAPSFAH